MTLESRGRPRWRRGAFAAFIAGCVAACSSNFIQIGSLATDAGADLSVPDQAAHDAGHDSTTSPDGSDAPSDSSSPSDGAPGCPSAPPTVDKPCLTMGLECEYGNNASPSCNDIFQCSSTGTWKSIPTPVGAPCLHDASCPPVATAPGTCSDNGAFCLYPGMKVCHCAKSNFQCSTPSAGCPYPRPNIGAPCSSAKSVVCDYGGCDGVRLVCKGGVWERTTPCTSAKD